MRYEILEKAPGSICSSWVLHFLYARTGQQQPPSCFELSCAGSEAIAHPAKAAFSVTIPHGGLTASFTKAKLEKQARRLDQFPVLLYNA